MENELGVARCSGIDKMEKDKEPSALFVAKRMELLPPSLNPGRFGSHVADGGLTRTLFQMPAKRVVNLVRMDSRSKLDDRAPHIAILRAVCAVSASSSKIFS